MKVDGTPYRSIWLADDGYTVCIIDQTKLPHRFETTELLSVEDAAIAIRDMLVRGAPLIGATGAYGLALAMRADPGDANLEMAFKTLHNTRPTASNLAWALNDVRDILTPLQESEREAAAYNRASEICEDDVATCRAIGEHGADVIRKIWEDNGKPGRINILTHCNAGWLATVDWGTALSAIYVAHEMDIPVHVWADETRPRNQGASLTAWELSKHGVPHTVIADNAGGHLMQHSQVDLCIVGTDRTTAAGDVCNKVGTYLKALAAHDNNVPFYVALPHSTIDWGIHDGIRDVPIETRSPKEITHISGKTNTGDVKTVQITPDDTQALNIAFDVTPARYITGLITERGLCDASENGLLGLYPECAS
ncbi:MAG: S-methyl-5-thioribose-1-phosphate isomerase [Alphaproteobacteria bacterium]|nr:S-methyl-5-thioribose-1-phosphate isomerase [Alphaproteobacteria bacterium]